MDIIWIIVILLFLGWFLGANLFYIGGSFIHLLLIVAVILIVYKLLRS